MLYLLGSLILSVIAGLVLIFNSSNYDHGNDWDC